MTAVEWLIEQIFGDNEIIGCLANLLLCVRARWTDEEVQMIKENWWWTPDLAAYYIPAKTGIQRSVKSFARKQKEILGIVPTNDYVDY